MYTPLFLGINNADWRVVLGIGIFLISGLLLIAGVFVYIIVEYVVKLIRRIRKNASSAEPQ
jgi:hypothetical protein